jgi:hypothetical protein
VDFLVNVAGGFRGGTLVSQARETIATCSASTDTAWWSCRAALGERESVAAPS